MRPIRSFVIRIYRRGKTRLDGVLEDVATGRSLPFHSSDELWQALQTPRRPTETPPPVPGSEPPSP